jgi:hypothetical protein
MSPGSAPQGFLLRQIEVASRSWAKNPPIGYHDNG